MCSHCGYFLKRKWGESKRKNSHRLRGGLERGKPDEWACSCDVTDAASGFYNLTQGKWEGCLHFTA